MESIFVPLNKKKELESIKNKYINENLEGFLTHREIPHHYANENVEIYRTPINRDTYDLISNSFDSIFISFFGKRQETNSKEFIFLNFLSEDIFNSEIINIQKDKEKKIYPEKTADLSEKIYFLDSNIGVNFYMHSTSKDKLLFAYRNYKNKVNSRFFYDKDIPSWYRRDWNDKEPVIIEKNISSALYNNCVNLEKHGLIYTIK